MLVCLKEGCAISPGSQPGGKLCARAIFCAVQRPELCLAARREPPAAGPAAEPPFLVGLTYLTAL